MAAPNEITVAQLLRLIGTPACPVLVDVSLDEDFDADPYLIPGAWRHPFDDPEGLLGKLQNQRVVVICQKGKKLSQGMAALLRGAGLQAEFLQGGNHGWRAHETAVRIPAATIPAPIGTSTLWVTRHRPKIDRIACPWLIRRFVDPAARFLFVAPTEVMGVAERYGATPFDVAGTFWTHEGTQCTFDKMLDVFGLHTPALDRMAQVIRAADTGVPDTVPEAPGLLAISIGLSRHCKDDLAQLDLGLTIYDALYRWARDGQGETHSSLEPAADQGPDT